MQVRMSFLVEFDGAAWAHEYGQGHPLENPEDFLSYFRQYFTGSPGSEVSDMKVLADKITIVKAGPKPTSKKSTGAVISFLMERDPYKSGQGGWERWEALPKDNVAAMKKGGVPYLRDKSEFASSTIDTVDWEEVYKTFQPFFPDRYQEKE